MNANELVDELKYIARVLNMNTDVDTQPIIMTASLLLQQQAEIEALKKQVIGDDYVFVCKRCGDELGIKFEAQEK